MDADCLLTITLTILEDSNTNKAGLEFNIAGPFYPSLQFLGTLLSHEEILSAKLISNI